jgi:uncharacterized protein (TIGR02996 family)
VRDEASFLKAIVERPDDDELRYMYGDFLEEQGDARAEFVRLQLRQSILEPWSLLRAQQQERLNELIAECGNEFLRELPPFPYYEISCERGLPHEIQIAGSSLVENAEHIIAATPTIRSLRLVRGGRWLREIADGLWLRHFQNLNLSKNELTNEQLSRLAFSEFSDELISLNLDTNRIGRATFATIARSDAFPKLREISFRHIGLRSEELALLADAEWGPSIRRLALHGNRIGERGIVAVGESRRLGNLRALDLRENGIDQLIMRRLANCDYGLELRELDLQQNSLQFGGVRAFTRSPAIRNLRKLWLGFNGIRDEGVDMLVESLPSELIACDLRGNQLTDAALVTLAAAEFPDLSYLCLSQNHIGDRGARALIDSPLAAGHAVIDLVQNEFSGVAQHDLLQAFGDRIRL